MSKWGIRAEFSEAEARALLDATSQQLANQIRAHKLENIEPALVSVVGKATKLVRAFNARKGQTWQPKG